MDVNAVGFYNMDAVCPVVVIFFVYYEWAADAYALFKLFDDHESYEVIQFIPRIHFSAIIIL